MTDTPMKVVVDCATGETTTVALNEAELAQREIDRVAYEAEKAQREADEQAQEDLKASANAKLLALGLTEAEVAALTA
jgi:hypothetical protein